MKELYNTLELERQAISVALWRPRQVMTVKLRPEHFASVLHRKLWGAMLELVRRGELVTSISVSDLLKDENIDFLLVAKQQKQGEEYMQLSQVADAIIDHATRRDIKEMCRELLKSNDTGHELHQVALQRLSGILPAKRVAEHPREFMKRVVEEIQKINAGEITRGITSGFRDIDDQTGGFPRGAVTIIAGRPSDGKSSLSLACLMRQAELGFRVDLFSLEDTVERIGRRMIARASGLDLHADLGSKKPNATTEHYQKINKAADRICGLPIHIFAHSVADVNELAIDIRSQVLNNKTEVVYVDFVQLLGKGTSSRAGNRTEELSEISRVLKNIARELNVAMVITSQFRRIGDEVPTMQDLRESGSLEQDAHLILLIHRIAEHRKRGDADVLVAKNKDGPTGTVKLKFYMGSATFGDMPL